MPVLTCHVCTTLGTDTCILLLIWHMYPPPHMTHVCTTLGTDT